MGIIGIIQQKADLAVRIIPYEPQQPAAVSLLHAEDIIKCLIIRPAKAACLVRFRPDAVCQQDSHCPVVHRVAFLLAADRAGIDPDGILPTGRLCHALQDNGRHRAAADIAVAHKQNAPHCGTPFHFSHKQNCSTNTSGREAPGKGVCKVFISFR